MAECTIYLFFWKSIVDWMDRMRAFGSAVSAIGTSSVGTEDHGIERLEDRSMQKEAQRFGASADEF